MGDFGEVPLDPTSVALAVFRENYGFIPRLYRAQSSLPRLVEAEAALASAILYHGTAVSRIEKESVVLAEAAAQGSAYCAALQWQTLLLLGVSPDRLTQLIRAIPRRHPRRRSTNAWRRPGPASFALWRQVYAWTPILRLRRYLLARWRPRLYLEFTKVKSLDPATPRYSAFSESTSVLFPICFAPRQIVPT